MKTRIIYEHNGWKTWIKGAVTLGLCGAMLYAMFFAPLSPVERILAFGAFLASEWLFARWTKEWGCVALGDEDRRSLLQETDSTDFS